MSHKSVRVARLAAPFAKRGLDARYAAWFGCFNRQLFYEAHEALEDLWLEDRAGADGAFYKGLIQLAGAFVHLRKDRLRPAAALLKLARANLERYPAVHRRLNVAAVRALVDDWLCRLESAEFTVNPFTPATAPQLSLLTAPSQE